MQIFKYSPARNKELKIKQANNQKPLSLPKFLKLKAKNLGDYLKILTSNSWSPSRGEMLKVEVKGVTSSSKFNRSTYLF